MPHPQPDQPAGTVDISVVAPMYNEVDNVARLVQALAAALEPTGRPFEVILVDDGSRDGTTEAIAAAEAIDGRVRGVYLARNYGQSTAMQAGFDHARGAILVSLDGDLQNDPTDIPAMIALMEETGADVVTGWRHQRQDEPVRKFFSRVANHLISRATALDVHDFGCSLKCYRREMLERTRLYGEMHRFLVAMLAEVGADVREMKVNHHPRRFGTSKYKLDRTIRVVLDLALIMFFRRYLQRPLHLFGGVGIGLSLLGGGILGYLAFIKLALGASIGDRPLLSLGVLAMLAGLMLVGQGLLGELICRTFFEAGSRAQYHVRLPHKVDRLRRSVAPVNPAP
jgi:glycosyltransferase involved in cell wall biosynthesis